MPLFSIVTGKITHIAKNFFKDEGIIERDDYHALECVVDNIGAHYLESE